MRNYKTSIYIKTIGLSEEDMKFIELSKGKKSKSGKLAEIIKFYRDNNKNTLILQCFRY